jgi:hypothetical protein
MTPRLGFYGAVAVCAFVKGRTGSVRELVKSAPRRQRTRRRRRFGLKRK